MTGKMRISSSRLVGSALADAVRLAGDVHFRVRQGGPYAFIIASVALFAFLPALALGNHFTVALEVSDGTAKQSAGTETEPRQAREVVVRPILEIKAKSHCTAKYKLTCASKELLKDVLVHFYVVKIDKPGQEPPPLEPKDVTVETAQTMDFAQGTTTAAELQFVPDQPGIYLIRVETQGTAEAKGHEHYAALELVVK